MDLGEAAEQNRAIEIIERNDVLPFSVRRSDRGVHSRLSDVIENIRRHRLEKYLWKSDSGICFDVSIQISLDKDHV